jgi:hypothetical protein
LEAFLTVIRREYYERTLSSTIIKTLFRALNLSMLAWIGWVFYKAASNPLVTGPTADPTYRDGYFLGVGISLSTIVFVWAAIAVVLSIAARFSRGAKICRRGAPGRWWHPD